MPKGPLILIVVVALLLVAAFALRTTDTEDTNGTLPPVGETADTIIGTDIDTDETLENIEETDMDKNTNNVAQTPTDTPAQKAIKVSGSEDFGPIPESEILSGGPGKDGIPSIDDPVFVSVKDADFLDDDEIGMGIVVGNDVRFYPFQVLVWHEIVNDTVGGIPLAVTYCPLCRTGVTYERRLDGETIEFGVSGLLWKSNLLMYNRTDDESNESLWSQVLGRAVRGPHTGKRLAIYSSDTVRYSDWKRTHPDTLVLSKETGHFRLYGSDPYGSYYTNRDVSFGANFTDTRLHPKEYVLGVELNGEFKAYVQDSLPTGSTTDSFAGKTVTINKDGIGGVRMSINGEPLPYIAGFWFSWVEVHPATELFN